MENGYGERNVRVPHIMADPGVAVPGSGGPWEWWTLGVADPGGDGPWEWLAVTDSYGGWCLELK